MIVIKLEEASSLTLEMEIEGDIRGNTPDMRFTVMSEGLQFSFPAKQMQYGVYAIEFPKMLGKITEGEYKAVVEIIIDGKYFQPLEERIRFTKEVKPVVKMNEVASPSVQSAAVSVKMGKLEMAPEAPKVEVMKITDVKGLVTHLVETKQDGPHVVDTARALRCLNSLVENKILDESATLQVAPSKAASEGEVLATIKMINRYGTDIFEAGEVDAIMKISERVRDEMRELFLQKGLPARELQRFL